MVKVRDEHPVLADGTIDLDKWIQKIVTKRSHDDENIIRKSCLLAIEYADYIEMPRATSCFEQGLAIADILNNLGLDSQTLVAGIIYDVYRYSPLTISIIDREIGKQVADLIIGIEKIDAVHDKNPLYVNKGVIVKQSIKNLRKMLLAVVEDVRVVLIKLAEHICEMRAAVNLQLDIKYKLAYEAREIYAPLANRLGIGQVKWELEDFSFRFIEPDIYKNIAKLLDERRVDREKYIEEVKDKLKTSLLQQGIKAEIYGRAKHIYSIWHKMQRKMVGYHEIYDVRALRLLVPTLTDCYSALGIVHSLWQHIPKEFDDYIASPKNNGYQSLHTAVIGPKGRVLEVQIRTQSMHEQAELGVAAHWRYKEGAQHDPGYEVKLKNLRQILSWQDELSSEGEVIEALKTEFFEDRVYVFTPNGDVVDLPIGSTALDFAYHIHTEIGHRCRGAKVNGHIVPLSQALQSGSQVKIITTKEGGPSRDWLNPHLKYLVTSKAKAKIHHWFKQQNKDYNLHAGKEILNRELRRLGYDNISFKDIVTELSMCNSEGDLFSGLGSGDIRISQIQGALQRIKQLSISVDNSLPIKDNYIHKRKYEAEITVEGIGDLLCHMARCCKPIPGDDIIGYIKVGEGVSIHRKDCINILQMHEKNQSRIISVNWGHDIKNNYAVNIVVKAYNRRGLLRDVTVIVASEQVDIIKMETLTNKEEHLAVFKMNLEITSVEILGKVLARIQQIPNIIEVYRVDE